MQEAFTAVTPWIPFIGLLSIRVGIVFATMPLPFSGVAPVQMRALFGLMVAYILALPHLANAPHLPMDAAFLLRAAFTEALLGAVIGLTARVTLAAVDVAGSLAGVSMGLGFATLADPNYDDQGLATAALMRAFATVVFLALSGHHMMLEALSVSVSAVPPGQLFSVAENEGLVLLGSTMVAHGLRMCAPVIATMFIVQVGIGLVSKVAPRVHLFAMSHALAAGGGLLMMFLTAASVGESIAVEISHLQDVLLQTLGGF